MKGVEGVNSVSKWRCGLIQSTTPVSEIRKLFMNLFQYSLFMVQAEITADVEQFDATVMSP